MDIKIELTKNPKPKPADETKLGFGHIFTDHMFVMDYDAGQGWHDARIVPYGPIELMPSAMVLHYGQEIFEGMKAYRTPSGDIQFFRPEENFKRMNVSAERLVIPQINEKDALEALHKLVEIDKIRVARKRREGLIGAVAVARGAQGQDLPDLLACRRKEIHKFFCLFAKAADPVGAGQAGHRHQNSTFTHGFTFLTFQHFDRNIVDSYHNISADYFPQAKNVVYLVL